ncbi:Uncharacterised protein [uncultured archaeon]|nr:Uncharacterised protein [uncultured archaeon]
MTLAPYRTTVPLDCQFQDTQFGIVKVASATLGPGVDPSRAGLSQSTMQEIFERNKHRIGDPKYDIDIAELFRLG